MTNSPLCPHCWVERAWGAETPAMLVNWETLPFEMGAEDTDYVPECDYQADAMDIGAG